MLVKGLYHVVSASEFEAVVRLSDENHPIFKAHFPLNPILPAFAHLEIIEDVFDIHIIKIKKAKFRALVCPTQTLVYTRVFNKIKITCDEKTVADFIL